MRALLVCLTSLVLIGLGAPADAGPSHHLPTVGSCHGYTYQALQKQSDMSPVVPCSGPHNAVTLAVLKVTTSELRQELGARRLARCDRALAATLGSDPVRTAYSLGYFYPTRAEIAKGARWARCDLVLYAGAALAPLSDPIITDVTDDRIARCVLRRKGSFLATPCALPHSYRVTGGYQAKGGKRYPGNDRLFGQAVRLCASQVLNPSDYYVNFPVESEWYAGYRGVVCLSRQST